MPAGSPSRPSRVTAGESRHPDVDEGAHHELQEYKLVVEDHATPVKC